ncbi:MAG: hypothetical protein COV44_05700 [Deltaproteobacteria bacterium CG11_big_fil_rev_8_21_14_0_20_45_16]|nr:MAG: hypothetical protein COV44_05700 [Deltaproteobacteria bacterium CG11_big_fil_rev_8_21_14_0_20_45_16]
MISCKDLARVVSSQTKVGFFKQLEIKLHVMMCVHCAKYVDHLKKIGTESRKLFRKDGPENDACVEEIKREVIKKLNEHSE